MTGAEKAELDHLRAIARAATEVCLRVGSSITVEPDSAGHSWVYTLGRLLHDWNRS